MSTFSISRNLSRRHWGISQKFYKAPFLYPTVFSKRETDKLKAGPTQAECWPCSRCQPDPLFPPTSGSQAVIICRPMPATKAEWGKGSDLLRTHPETKISIFLFSDLIYHVTLWNHLGLHWVRLVRVWGWHFHSSFTDHFTSSLWMCFHIWKRS